MTINKSIGELTTLDGSLDKTLKASEQLKDLPQILQKYMLLGNYQIGNAKKFDSHSIFNDIGSIDGFIAQFVNLDEAQQKAFLSLSSFDEGLEDYIENTKNAVQIGEKFNSQLFEQIASQKDGITTGVLNEFMKAGGLKDAKGVLALPNTQDAIALMEDYANHCSDASKTQQLFNAGILEQENGVYKLSQAFLKEISVKQASTVATVALTAAQKAWNVVAQYGKQLLLSLGVAAVAFIATKIVDYLMNLKTHSEELVATMNDSHDAAEQATKDVEEIQSKIDELNKSLKDAGVKKIEDIVDPAERERLQAINDMLQAQLELKKQLEKDANDKANADTSAVVNDKTEDSIVKSRTVNVSYAEGGANAGTHQVAEKVSKTESLHEYAAALEDTTQKRRDLQVELDQIEASSGKDSEEYKATDETDKKNDATANEDKTVKTAATTLTGAGLGAAAGMAVGGPVGALIGTLLGGFAGFFLGGHANGLKSSKTNHFANVDERGSELSVRKPASGRYTYLETGDGVVPADITSRLFEMGGNPDKWFSDQLAKHSSASMVQSRDAGGISLSIGDVNVNNPVGDSDALARELVNRLPNKVVQELNRR